MIGDARRICRLVCDSLWALSGFMFTRFGSLLALLAHTRQDEKRWFVERGHPSIPPTLPLPPPSHALFCIDFPIGFFIDSFSILALILAPFWNTFHVFCIPFSRIEFALIFYRFFTDFWYPWSCKKTILTLYPSQKTRNRRFWNFIDLPLILDLILVSFW